MLHKTVGLIPNAAANKNTESNIMNCFIKGIELFEAVIDEYELVR